jgi:hypothetical protein
VIPLGYQKDFYDWLKALTLNYFAGFNPDLDIDS